MAVNVPLTNYSGEKISRHDLLNWVNDTLAANYNKIEELCTGIAYCQLMEKLFPGSVAMKRLKANAKMDHEYIWNLKLFQSAFTKLECEKTVPINQLMKGKFQDNFEFLLWFKKFYDVNSDGSMLPKFKETNNNNQLKPIKKTTSSTAAKVSQNSSGRSSHKGTPSPRTQSPKKDGSQSPSILQMLTVERDNLKLHQEVAEKEKLSYFERLRKVEILCDENENNPEFLDVIKKIRNVLYDTNVEEGEVASEENLEKVDKPLDASTEF